MAVQCVKAGVPSRLLGKQIRPAVRSRTDRAALSAVNSNALEVGCCLGAVALGFGGLGRIRPKDVGDVPFYVLELHVGNRHRAKVTAGASERNPRGRGVQTFGGDHAVLRVRSRERRNRICPVGERGREAVPERHVALVVGKLVPDDEAVGHRLAVLVRVNPRQGGQDVVRRMGDERSMVVGKEGPVVFEEIQQIGHLLQVRRNVGDVALEVHVVELNKHNVADLAAGRIQRAPGRLRCG